MKSNLISIVIFMAFVLGCGTIYHFVEVAKYKDEIRSLQWQIDDLGMRLTFTQQELSACRRDSSDLEKKLLTTSEKLRDRTEEWRKAIIRLEKMSQTKAELERRIESFEAEVTELKAQLASKQAQLGLLLNSPQQAEEVDQSSEELPIAQQSSIQTALLKSERAFLFFMLLIIGSVGVLSIVANKRYRYR